MTIGIINGELFQPAEILGPGSQYAMIEPVTIYRGATLAAGTVLGVMPASGLYQDYDNAGAAVSTGAVADAGNTGDNTMGAVGVTNAATLSEDWTVTCDSVAGGADAETWAVVGSVSGLVGTATTNVLFAPASGEVSFTISVLTMTAAAVGDQFTFTTTAAKGTTAHGILVDAVDTSDGRDRQGTMAIKNARVRTAAIVGLDNAARADLLAREVGNYIVI